jgi:hypothetical protein
MNEQHMAITPVSTSSKAVSHPRARRARSSPRAKCSISRRNGSDQEAHGIDDPKAGPYAMRRLMARRLVERGVRFVQVTTSPDSHGSPQHVKRDMHKIATEVDQGSAALVKVSPAGAFSTTIVMWATRPSPHHQNGDGRTKSQRLYHLVRGRRLRRVSSGETDNRLQVQSIASPCLT